MDSSYAKIIFEKQEQSALARAVKNANYADQKGRPAYAILQCRVYPVLLLHPEKHSVPLRGGAERHSTESAGDISQPGRL